MEKDRVHYYSLDALLGKILTKWYVYTFTSLGLISLGIMVVDFPIISHYAFAFIFIVTGVLGMLMAMYVKKYLHIAEGHEPHLLFGDRSIVAAVISLFSNRDNIRDSVTTDFSRQSHSPQIDKAAFAAWDASIIGDVIIGKNVYLAPHSFVRGDEGHPLYVGEDSNIQDCAGVHALETETVDKDGNWKYLDNRRFSADGELLMGDSDKEGFAVYIGKRVSVAHQAIVHGPAFVGDDTFVGLQSQIFNAKVEKNCFIGVKSLVTNGVVIKEGSFVPPGSVITEQAQADELGKVADSGFSALNAAVVHVNKSLASKGIEEKKKTEVPGITTLFPSDSDD